jgi:hypothetical protein
MSWQVQHKKYWVIGIIVVVCIIAAIFIANIKRTPSYTYKDGKPILTTTPYGDVPVEPFLEIPDDAYDFLYMDDDEDGSWIQRKSNPAAYWLMNRMMQMFSQITFGPDTIWAWKCAVDESVVAYNRCIHRQIDGSAGRDMAIKDVINYSDYLNCGGTPEMTQGSYIAAVVSLYQALDIYNSLMDSTKDSYFKKLIFSEYCAWETYQEYDWDCEKEWMNNREWHSDLPNEINWYFVGRMEKFQKSIRRDYDIIVLHKEYAATTKYSLEQLTAQLSDARVPVDSTDIKTFVPGYFDKWVAARNEVNIYLKGNQAASYQNATRDIIEEYLRPTPVETINY